MQNNEVWVQLLGINRHVIPKQVIIFSFASHLAANRFFPAVIRDKQLFKAGIKRFANRWNWLELGV
jgi:hypothetical protein